MTEQSIILSRLLDKFENSKHLSDPGTSHRRVMLRVEKKELVASVFPIRNTLNETFAICSCGLPGSMTMP